MSPNAAPVIDANVGPFVDVSPKNHLTKNSLSSSAAHKMPARILTTPINMLQVASSLTPQKS